MQPGEYMQKLPWAIKIYTETIICYDWLNVTFVQSTFRLILKKQSRVNILGCALKNKTIWDSCKLLSTLTTKQIKFKALQYILMCHH